MNLGGEGANSAFFMTHGTKSPAREITRPCNTCNKAEVKKETMPLSHLNALVKSSYRSRLDHHSKNIGQIHHLFLKHLMYMCSLVRTHKTTKPIMNQPAFNLIAQRSRSPYATSRGAGAYCMVKRWPFQLRKCLSLIFFDLTSENGGIRNQNDDNLKWTFNPAKITCWGAGQQEMFFFRWRKWEYMVI